MRVFLGVKLPDRLQRELTTRLDGLGPLPPLRWVDPVNWHVTLKFLGDWPPDRCNDLQKNMLWSRDFPAFSVTVGGVGQFPERGPLRVLFLQILGGAELAGLAARAGEAVITTWPDGPRDDKPFRPHLTLARGARTPLEIPERLARGLSGAEWPVWPIEAFALLSSNPGPGGVDYREEAVFELRK